jgi:hypothetical protein
VPAVAIIGGRISRIIVADRALSLAEIQALQAALSSFGAKD